MDLQRWTSAQRSLREAVRAQRRTPDGRSPLEYLQEGPALKAHGPDPADISEPRAGEAVPLVSVIVVCWNSADVIGRCLDQLLAQDYGNYEIILVDDGSDDDTVEIAQSALGSGKLEILRSPRNRGCPHARNLGLAHANGEVVAFIDADGFAAPSWLRHVVECFDADATIGGVASTVFFAENPLVINGAGGIVNRQGWAADLAMNESYERAEIVSEALYPMGCGMAVRRSAAARVGPFDDRMLNYYDDVDYGARIWRAGYRVVVAPDAWIDHGFASSGRDSTHKQLLCERHRMRVVLKHASARTMARWAVHEARAAGRASAPRRALKLKATAWNLCHLPSVLAGRWRMRRAPRVPDRLVDPSWGDGFPAGVPPSFSPRPDSAGSGIDMADAGSDRQLLHGWFPAEHVEGRSYRWAGEHAAALIRLEAPAKRMRLDYAHVPVDVGGVDVRIRRSGSSEPLVAVWAASLPWQYIARSVENHPLALPAGEYEVVFSVRQGWSDPPLETRALGLALSGVSLHESFEVAPGGLDMASPAVEEQLVSGWFEAEQSAERSYRWGTGHAAALVRLRNGASSARLSYCLPPGPTDGLKVIVCPLDQRRPVWSTSIAWLDAAWHDESFPLQLPAGDYMVSFDAEAAWSNPGGRDPVLWAESRSLGFALSSLSFGEAA